MPELDYVGRKLEPILDDPGDLRTEFLRLPHNSRAALKFLEKVGVWSAWKIKTFTSKGPQLGTPFREHSLDGPFGHRYLSGLGVLPFTMEELWEEQAYWRKLLLSNLTPLRRKFAGPPRDEASAAEKEAFATDSEFGNTLPIHLEWKGGPGQYPRAVIQPLTWREFLIAAAWLDIVRQERVQVCQRTDCGLPFTGREQKYCSDSCAHLMAVRAFRERKKKAQRRRGSKPPKKARTRLRKRG